MARKSTGSRLVIVESPAKAKTIQKYLGPGYVVEASVGHIRDLPKRAAEIPAKYKAEPWSRLGIDVENNFAPIYVVDPGKKTRVAELKRHLAESDELLLATDEDREGEAIAWHLLEVLQPKVPVSRMVFNEITPDAIRRAAENTREIDQNLVDAQESRRLVDRLYGYEVSPVLWKKVQSGLSAGRVQSVATRLVVDRERERIAFRNASYWDLTADLAPGPFPARLLSVEGQRLATGQSFGSDGQLKRADVLVLDESGARQLAAALDGRPFVVGDITEKPGTKRPAAPFMTSTLQREAINRLGWSAQRTMRVAQGLYERGYITYMRTDSTSLSQTAVDAARAQAADLYGAQSVASAPRTYSNKVKNAQEAHEAIRPAGDRFRTPGDVAGELQHDDYALYDMIWRRTLASQMADAKVSTTTVRIDSTTSDARRVEFTASGTVVVFPGFLAAYDDDMDEDGQSGEAERRLPVMRLGQDLEVRGIKADGHTTQPPARYTEASLVKELESRGIGRPSTYASILGTIEDRGYVTKRGRALVPSWLAFTVVRLLEDHFRALIDYDFTARMEETLDAVSEGTVPRVDALTSFYYGDKGRSFAGLHPMLEQFPDIDARALSTFPIAGTDIVLRVGRYGPYLQRDEERASVPEELAPDELTAEKAEELIALPSGDRELGVDPETGLNIVAKAGRYGPYVSEVLAEDAPKSAKPRTGSLFKTMSLDTITIDDALRLLSLPRVVGSDAEGVDITAQNGRYGPYISRDKDSRSLTDEEQLFTLTLDEALALLAQPKLRGRGRVAAPPLKEFDADPVSGAPVVVREGRFGPYVTDGETNASLRVGDKVETLTSHRAYELLAEKRAKGPAPKKKAAKKTTAKKSTAKKTTAKKTAAKKSTAKKTTAKKSTAKKSAAKKAATAKKSAANTALAAQAAGEV
jgi:DNA topoisomerase-1